jgi:hypothetical protein
MTERGKRGTKYPQNDDAGREALTFELLYLGISSDSLKPPVFSIIKCYSTNTLIFKKGVGPDG